MAQSINLLPQDEQKVQQRTKLVKASTVVSIVLLTIVSLVAAYYFYTSTMLNREISETDNDIAALRSEINNLSEVEIVVRNLDKRYSTLKDLFASTVFYSELISELRSRTPGNISVEDLNTSDEALLTISGSGTDYLAVSAFITSLTEQKQATESTQSRNYFGDVELKSVNLESQSGLINYFLTVTYNKEMLTR